MLKRVSFAFGIISLIVALILSALDFGLFIVHKVLQTASDKFAQDGQVLTGWRVAGDA
jgi:hypothetical protein